MGTDLVTQNTDFVEQAKQFPAGCDFFKELWALYVPHAAAVTEAFRQDWVAKYEKGEIEMEDWDLEDGRILSADEEGWNMTNPESIAMYQEACQLNVYSDVFPQCAMLPITDTHREFIVICHARRLDTEAALIEMVNYFEEFASLRQHLQLREKEIDGVLIEVPEPEKMLLPLFRVWKRAFSYLRPTHTRWPQQKYGALWREAKAAYTQARMLETAGTREAVIAGLAEAVEKAQDLVASSSSDQFDRQTKALISLSTALHKILLDEQES